MQIVIDISEERYKEIMAMIATGNQMTYTEYCVGKGTVLPKGHGRLIVADELELDADWDDYYDGWTAYSESMIKYAPTIIEADKED